MALTISAENNTEKSTWEITLEGEVDISNADLFKTKVETSLAEKKQDIQLDLSGLDYIDSTGLGVIMGTYGMVKKEGFSVKIINPKQNVKKLLTISGLDKILG